MNSPATSPQPSQRAQQLWYSIGKLAFMYEFSEATVRRWVKAGKFGALSDTRYVLDLDGDIRVSGLGCACFEAAHPLVYDNTVRARNAGELRRRLKLVPQPGEQEERHAA